MKEWARECRGGEMGSWRVLGTEEGLEDLHLLALAVGTQGRATGAQGGCGALRGHESLGALPGYLVPRTCGTGFRETGADG